jgi:hypothetical protein
MKKVWAYRQWAGLVMLILMSLHIFSGLRLFCPNQLRSLGIDIVALAITAPGHDRGEVSAATAGSRSGTSKCNCKKQCPVVPRAAITINPTQRFNGVQRQFKSVCCHSLLSHGTDYRLFTGSGPPLVELMRRTSFCSSAPLAITCALLI